MHESSSAQKKASQRKQMREKFPFKETKSVLYGSMLVTGLEKGGGREGAGGEGVVVTFSLILTSKQRTIVTKKISF